jgi:hypothetical protein
MLATLTPVLSGVGVAPATNSYFSIATGIGTGSNTTIDFNSIPQTFTHLQVRGSYLSSVNDQVVLPSYNGVRTGGTYAIHGIRGNGSSVSAYGLTSYDFYQIGTATQSRTTMPEVFVLDILDYTNTNKYKTTRWLAGNDFNGSGGIELGSVLWNNSAAITSISFPLSSGNFPTGSIISLYGVK